MNRLAAFVLILTSIVACRKDNLVPEEEVAGIVGKWRVVEQQYTIGDSTVKAEVPEENAWIYLFRPDGVLVNENGYMPCCRPQQYFLNGKWFEPKPAIPALLDPFCANVYCAYCPEMSVKQLSTDVIVIEICDGNFQTFVREK